MSVERLRNQERVRGLLARLARVKFLREQLDESVATWLVHPDKSRLDLGFIHRGRQVGSNGLENSAYAGLDFMGAKKTIGLLVTTEADVDDDWAELRKNAEIAHLIDTQGANVAVVTAEQLEEWLRFYQYIEKDLGGGESLMERLGRDRAGELSGLTRLRANEETQLGNALEGLLVANANNLRARGVDLARARRGGFGMDVVLVNGDGDFVPQTITHYRGGEVIEGAIVREWVEDGADKVIGFSLRHNGENKREHLERVAQIERDLNERLGTTDLKICRVGVGSERLWQKLGMLEHPSGSFPEVGDQLMRAYRLLYFGKDNLNPGPMAMQGLSLPGYGNNFGFDRLDGVFFGRDRHGQPRWRGVDNLLAMKGGKLREMGNVAGFVVFPDDLPFDQREAYIKPAAVDFNRRTGMVGANIWHLDRRLLDEIERRGTPFVRPGEVRTADSAKKAVNYFVLPGGSADGDGVFMDWWRQGPQVGGNIHRLRIRRGGVETSILGDLGYSFDQGTPIAFRGIGKQPPTTDGLRRQFTYGDLPMIPEVWEIWYLIHTANNWPGLGNPEIVDRDPVAMFLIGELYARLNKDQVLEIFSTEVAEAILTKGPYCMKKFRKEMEMVTASAVPTHTHYDHMGGYPFVDKGIKQIVSGPMWAAMIAMTGKAPNWRAWYTRVADITSPIKPGQAYPRADKDIQVWWKSGQEMRLTPEVSYRPWTVDHPVPGTWQLFKANGVNVFVTGDWRPGEATLRAMEGLGKESVDVVVMEATNLGEHKPNMNRVEQDVERAFEKMLAAPESKDRAVVAVVSPNSYERLYRLVQAARAAGRQVALTESHAISAMEFEAVSTMAPTGAEGFEWVIPQGVLGEDGVTVWAKKMTMPRAHHQSVRTMAAASELGLLTPERLALRGEAGNWVIVVTPFESLGDQFGNTGIYKPRLWYSAPSLYSADARNFYRANRDWWTSGTVGGDWVGDFKLAGNKVEPDRNKYGPAHVSGHAGPAEIYGLLSLLISRGAKRVFAVHTDMPAEVQRLLEKKFGRRVEIVTSFPRYDPRDPIGKPGASFRLD